MAAILGPNVIVAQLHAERALNWAQLREQYREYAFHLHHLALGERPTDHNEIGPIYVRQALMMQLGGLELK